MKPSKTYLITLISLWINFSLSALAGPANFGPEMVFTNSEIDEGFEERLAALEHKLLLFPAMKAFQINAYYAPTVSLEGRWASLLTQAILENCKGCTAKTHFGKFSDIPETLIQFPDGYWVNVSVDQGAVELQSLHAPRAHLVKIESQVQKNIYDIAKTIGLYPITDADSHINIGAKSAFQNGTELLRFIADFAINHPELAMGVLGYDPSNAPSLHEQTQLQYERLLELVGEANNSKVPLEIFYVANRYAKDVCFTSLEFNKHPGDGAHYQALSTRRVRNLSDQDTPVEWRAMYGQSTFKNLLLVYELFEKRIAYLETLKNKSIRLRAFDPQLVQLSFSELLSRFVIFTREMGEDYKKYLPIIMDHQIRNAPLDRFVSGEISWDRMEDVRLLERYLPDIEVSPWVRTQFSKIMQTIPNGRYRDFFNRKHQKVLQQLPVETPKKCSSLFMN